MAGRLPAVPAMQLPCRDLPSPVAHAVGRRGGGAIVLEPDSFTATTQTCTAKNRLPRICRTASIHQSPDGRNDDPARPYSCHSSKKHVGSRRESVISRTERIMARSQIRSSRSEEKAANAGLAGGHLVCVLGRRLHHPTANRPQIRRSTYVAHIVVS